MRKRVLVTEIMYPKGHEKLDEDIVKVVSEICDVVLLDYNGYFKEVSPRYYKEKVSVKPLMWKKFDKISQIFYAFYMRKVARLARKYDCDTVIMLTFNTVAFGYVRKKFQGIDVIVCHHYEIDRMTRDLRDQHYFNTYKNSIKHVVLENFIREGLIQNFKVDADRVFTLHKPIDFNEVQTNSEMSGNVLLGIGRSNNEKMIEHFIELDEKGCFDSSYKIFLRSKNKTYKGKSVTVICGFLERCEYEKMYNDASVCLIDYSQSYVLRSSGSIEDAFTRRKKVIVTDFPAGKFYAEEFPHNCLICRSVEDMIFYMKENKPYDSVEGTKFQMQHDMKKMPEKWKNVIYDN